MGRSMMVQSTMGKFFLLGMLLVVVVQRAAEILNTSVTFCVFFLDKFTIFTLLKYTIHRLSVDSQCCATSLSLDHFQHPNKKPHTC